MNQLRHLIKTEIGKILLSESFYYRSDNELNNVITSFKNLFLNLRNALDQKYQLEFFKDNLKQYLYEYKIYLSEHFNKQSKKEFAKKITNLINEIDHDLLKEIGLGDLVNKILTLYKSSSETDSIDIIRTRLETIFDTYINSINTRVENVYELFKEKFKDNNFSEDIPEK